ncbi:MAG: hypothetical protein ABFC96_15605 [Thermoguttaceae bacterium]
MKVAVALCVLLGGVCASVLFRHDSPRPATAVEPLAIPCHGRGGEPAGREPAQPHVARLLAPSVQAAPPSSVERPQPIGMPDAQRGRFRESMLPPLNSPIRVNRTHRIVDGDTLAGLAERYLGSAARANEIFAANRDVLLDPKLLPIGVTLRIPPSEP